MTRAAAAAELRGYVLRRRPADVGSPEWWENERAMGALEVLQKSAMAELADAMLEWSAATVMPPRKRPTPPASVRIPWRPVEPEPVAAGR